MRLQKEASVSARAFGKWRTVVLNDPINLMDYVTHVLRRHFGYSWETCESLMMQIHTKGRAVVSEGLKERMEADVVAMHSYGLHATLEPVIDGGDSQ
nr:ATP-dependent Clp protease adapter ClpS [Schaalia vaccimaxillae]